MSSRLPRDEGGGGDLLAETVCCPQCRRKYGGATESPEREAKLLNCLDTFCLDCLLKRIHDVTTNYPWQAVSCQLCQTPIDAGIGGGGPAEGGGGIETRVRTNPVVERLLKIEAITSDPNAGHRNPCDACAESENFDGRTEDQQHEPAPPSAEVYCEECDQKLCSACHAAHGKLRQTKSHKPVVRLGSQESKALARSWKDVLPFCSSHGGLSGEFYCATCGEYACDSCAKEHAARHKTPCCRPSVQVAQELRAGLTRQGEEIAKLGREAKAKQESIKHKRKLFAASVDAASSEIQRRAEAMHHAIDQHRDELAEELEKLRVKTEEEFEEELDSAKRSELRLNRFVKFTGLAVTVDLATLEELRPLVNQRATELKGARCSDDVQFAAACLAPGLWQQTVAVCGGNSIGNLEVKRSSQA